MIGKKFRLPKIRSLLRQGLNWLKKPTHIGLVGLILTVGIILARTQMPFSAAVFHQDSIPVNGPVTLEFGQDVSSRYQVSISPATPGSWRQIRTPLGVSAVQFTPKDKLKVAKTYSVEVTGLKRSLTGMALPDIHRFFTTEIAIGIQSITPTNNSQNVGVSADLTVVQSESTHYSRQLVAKLEPAVKLNQTSTGQTLSWKPAASLKQGTSYTFSVEDPSLPPQNRLVLKSKFITVTQPAIVSARSGDHFNKDQTVDIVFDQAMNTSSNAFKFDLAGKGAWINPKTYQFKPSSLEPGKTYKYQVNKGLRSKVGGVLEADHPYQFATNGAVTASFSPGGVVSLNAPMNITFDQAVDHASAQAHFSVSPTLAGKFSWSGNTMTYYPSGAAYQTGYTFQIAPGVTPTWGLPSAVVQSGSYTTTSQTIKLGVPLFAQPYGRSCELTSLRMLLAYRGIQTSEMDIVGKIGYNPRAKDTSTNSWDDPNHMFVGFIDTFDWNVGYGVYSGPVAAAAQSYGRSASSFYGVSAQFIASNIYAGNPVEVYGHIGNDFAETWNTPGGPVNATSVMHARVVYGVYGSADNPIGFYVNDPWTDSASYWSAGALLGNMNAVPGISNQAVVVY